ncbi:hypothetical protein [Deinococcus aquaedulcis]|uniref:hypothetical protein n=1 Tax=Deinococcus aquaedulcis TaxID=2840455 RepID=UPI001C83454B|nr:hypothetical protein [Deinococcus aquaedulcis]
MALSIFLKVCAAALVLTGAVLAYAGLLIGTMATDSARRSGTSKITPCWEQRWVWLCWPWESCYGKGPSG